MSKIDDEISKAIVISGKKSLSLRALIIAISITILICGAAAYKFIYEPLKSYAVAINSIKDDVGTLSSNFKTVSKILDEAMVDISVIKSNVNETQIAIKTTITSLKALTDRMNVQFNRINDNMSNQLLELGFVKKPGGK